MFALLWDRHHSHQFADDETGTQRLKVACVTIMPLIKCEQELERNFVIPSLALILPQYMFVTTWQGKIVDPVL